jgi:hypothetical protein
MWYFKVTKADGRMMEVGPYPSEDDAATMASDYATDNPDDTVGSAEEKPPGYVTLAPQARVHNEDGTQSIIYNDGTIVNIQV